MKLSRNVFIFLLIFGNIAADQVSKFWVRATVVKNSVSPIIGDYLTLRNIENDGAFLGMGGDLNPTIKLFFLLIIPAAVLLFVLYYMIREKNMDRLTLIGFACVLGGGIANVFDRFVYGSVTDFLFIDLGFVRTGIFNIADMSVSAGMIMILWASFIHRKKKTTEVE